MSRQRIANGPSVNAQIGAIVSRGLTAEEGSRVLAGVGIKMSPRTLGRRMLELRGPVQATRVRMRHQSPPPRPKPAETNVARPRWAEDMTSEGWRWIESVIDEAVDAEREAQSEYLMAHLLELEAKAKSYPACPTCGTHRLPTASP